MTDLLPQRTTAPVWDRFVRLFHWSLVACVLGNFFVFDDGDTLHQAVGLTAGALVVARLVWGFVGSTHARFASFFPTAARLKRHFAALRTGTPEDHDGHNPAGAVMMLFLLALVLGVAATGFLQTTDAFWGEAWLEELHETLADILIACAALHAFAAIVMSFFERTNLVAAMFTGIKVRRGKPQRRR